MSKHCLFSVSSRLKKAILKLKRVLFRFRHKLFSARANTINGGRSSSPRRRNLSFDSAEIGLCGFFDVENSDDDDDVDDDDDDDDADDDDDVDNDDADDYDVDQRAEDFINAFRARLLMEQRILYT